MTSLLAGGLQLQATALLSPPSCRASSPTIGRHWTAYVKGKGKEDTYVKPWADQPWPLIDLPGRTQTIIHPAQHIADEIAQIHNAMIRGLNALFLQAPHVQKSKDIADLLFLAQSWATWVLDHHDLKEGIILPEFESIMGLQPGSLTLNSGGAPGSIDPADSSLESTKAPNLSVSQYHVEGDDDGVERVSAPLRQVYSYSTAKRCAPRSYDATVFQNLLAALAEILVPHLTAQVGMLLSLRELCLVQTTAVPTPTKATSEAQSTTGAKAADVPISRRRRDEARALWEADARATRLLQHYITAEGRASAAMDSFVVLPMIVRLRDATAIHYHNIASSPHAGPPPSPAASSSSSSSKSSSSSSSAFTRGTIQRGGGGGVAGGEWPRLSVLALHAVADKLSLRHAGAWRFLPCDVWGRPRELAFLG